MNLSVALFFFIAFVPSQCFSTLNDAITPNQTLLDNGETLVSVGEKFELGFFSPETSKNRYVGLWFKNVPVNGVVWVANRDRPIADRSGILTVTQTGNILILSNQSTVPIWSSNSSAKSPTLQLLSTGNLVVRNGASLRYAWQSFDHPCDTLIAGMKLGWDLETGQNWFLSSWTSSQDPSTGNFTYSVDPRGLAQLIQRNGKVIQYRSGPWDGVRFGGDPPLGPNPIYKPIFVFNETHVYYTFEIYDEKMITKFLVSPEGLIEQFRWNYDRKEWLKVFTLQKQECDVFARCGANGICDTIQNINCACPKGFVPKVAQDWERFDWGSGCVAKNRPSCGGGEGFRRLSRLKLPYGERFLVDRNVVKKEECKEICLRNCSCNAFTLGRVGGCMMWFSDLLDMSQYSEEGQDLFIRVAASEVDSEDNMKTRTVAIVSASVILVFLAFFSFFGYIFWKRICTKQTSQAERMLTNEDVNGGSNVLSEDLELPSFDLDTLVKATNNFSLKNKIGEGGFGPVYMGVLPTGEEIAVKRLSKESGQGVKEFKNEVILIAKLQHRNLVKLLGCCIHREERMLIYEYMPNKSLDLYIFNQTKGTALNWKMRFDIIVGIARGLLYLHRDSRLRIIHRDLKASNILLDSEMNPKISDFGLARIFGGDQTEVTTRTVVGTYGYMSPEYAIDGLFSVKSDVFSFGVIVLEILCGKKNRGFDHPDHDLNLLGHAWKLWNEGRPLELTDELLTDVPSSEVLRCIQVGLLCVQKRPEERPLMSSVLFMLDSDNPSLPQPKQPGFYMERVYSEMDSSSSSWNKPYPYASTELTVTKIQGR